MRGKQRRESIRHGCDLRIVDTGTTAAAVARLVREGTVIRVSRGLYQLAEAANRIERGWSA